MNRLQHVLMLSLSILGLLLAPVMLQAAEPTIIISEIGWAGSSVNNADEYLELQNLTSEQIDLSSFRIEGAATKGADLILPEGSVLEPHSTFLITNYANDHDKSALLAEPDLATSSLSLSNSKLGLILRDAGGTLLDNAGNGTSPFAGRAGGEGEPFLSMRRISILNGDEPASWADAVESSGFDEGIADLGTPGSPEHFDEPLEESDVEESEESEEAEELEENEIPPSEPVYTPPGTLIINELVSNPREGEDEFVEVKNPYNNVIDLSGWAIRDKSGAKTALPDQLLGMHQFVVVLNPKGKLNNGSETIDLVDQNNVAIDSVSYGNAYVDKPGKGESLSRLGDMWQITEFQTPKMENIFTPEKEVDEVPEVVEALEITEEKELIELAVIEDAQEEPEPIEETPLPFTLKLWELYPNTGGEDATAEFIEIKNIGAEPVNLNGLSLEDRGGKTYTHETDELLAPGDLRAFLRTETHLSLNNDADTVKLMSPDGKLTDLKAYENAKPNLSLAREGNDWRWSTSVTQGESNLLTAPQDPIRETAAPRAKKPSTKASARRSAGIRHLTIGEAKTLRDNARVSLSGTVSVAPGVLGKQILYVQDENSGVQIYKHDAAFPELLVGDQVKIVGTLSTSRGERRVKITKTGSISKTESGTSPEPTAVARLGMLTTLEGHLATRSGDNLAFEDENFEVKLKAGTAIDKEIFERGAKMRITGILLTEEPPTILPRGMDDIELIESPREEIVVPAGLAKELERDRTMGSLLGIASLLTLLFFAARHLTPSIKELYAKRRPFRQRLAKTH